MTTGCLLHGVSLDRVYLVRRGIQCSAAMRPSIPTLASWSENWSRSSSWSSLISSSSREATPLAVCYWWKKEKTELILGPSLLLCWGTEPQDLQEGAPSSAAARDARLPAQLLKGGRFEEKEVGVWPLTPITGKHGQCTPTPHPPHRVAFLSSLRSSDSTKSHHPWVSLDNQQDTAGDWELKRNGEPEATAHEKRTCIDACSPPGTLSKSLERAHPKFLVSCVMGQTDQREPTRK